MSHDLEQLQRWLQSVIMHPHGIAAGIDSADARAEINVDPADVEQVITRSQAQTSIERLEIYGGAYYARLLDCLRDSFPVLRAALGPELFDQFAVGYLQRFPSTSYTLGKLGADFARYLEETRPDHGTLAPGEVSWPDFLIDVVRLEWAIGEVFDGPGVEEEPKLDAAKLAAIDPAVWPRARLVPVPCLRLLEFRFPVNDFFTANHRSAQAGAEADLAADSSAHESPELPAPEDSYLALTRINYIVRRIPLSAPQHTLLAALAAGQSMCEAIEMMAATVSQSDSDNLADALRGWFAEWGAAGLFLRVDLPKE